MEGFGEWRYVFDLYLVEFIAHVSGRRDDGQRAVMPPPTAVAVLRRMDAALGFDAGGSPVFSCFGHRTPSVALFVEASRFDTFVIVPL